jgi:hypothetical protein
MDNQRFRVNTPTVTHEIIDGEAVIINLDSGNYYSLIEAGSFIWAMVERGASPVDVQHMVQQTYQGDAGEIDRGVQELLTQLQQENLIVPVEGTPEDELTEVLPSNNGHEKPLFNVPLLNKFSDMQELLLLDPIHDVDDAGWPKPVTDPPK